MEEVVRLLEILLLLLVAGHRTLCSDCGGSRSRSRNMNRNGNRMGRSKERFTGLARAFGRVVVVLRSPTT